MRTNLLRRALVALAAVLAMSGVAVMAPSAAQAAWDGQHSVTIQVTGAGQNLGYADGWIQFNGDGETFRYSVTVCRQSSYTPPHLTVSYNTSSWDLDGTPVTTHYMSGSQTSDDGPCYGLTTTFTGQYSRQGLNNVYFVLSGNTFVNGNNFTVFTQDRLTW
ncbi:hypothetical protein [Glycomyces arizonensis]|uniref:hypothetical protein n=1 Tax=Glycomyces arizonensis TaxID=256035 RepID=UPI0004185F25|nr:hypothetical protein [Glycomyces arizonensis]